MKGRAYPAMIEQRGWYAQPWDGRHGVGKHLTTLLGGKQSRKLGSAAEFAPALYRVRQRCGRGQGPGPAHGENRRSKDRGTPALLPCFEDWNEDLVKADFYDAFRTVAGQILREDVERFGPRSRS